MTAATSFDPHELLAESSIGVLATIKSDGLLGDGSYEDGAWYDLLPSDLSPGGAAAPR